MLRTTRRAVLAAALGTTLALSAGTASASAAATISGLPDRVPIVNKLYVPIPLTVSCDSSDFIFGVSVTIRQLVSGKHIAHGTGTVNTLTCDAVPHDYTVNVFPDTAGFPGGTDSPPFAKGDAVVTAQASGFFGSASAGPQPIRLTK
jgi:hypothetical protein